MRVAALYDIHGNLPALKAVLQEVDQLGVDQLVIGGDVVPGPMPRDCLDKLTEINLPTYFIKGNGEVSVFDQSANGLLGNLPEKVLESTSWNTDQLLSGHHKFMAGWPKCISLEIERLGKVLFCHATPRNENEIFTSLTAEEKLLPVFEKIPESLVICGHTHMQFDRNIGKVRVINAGSVGMPFGRAGADWLLLGPDIELRHTTYDLHKGAKQILNTDYPRAKDFAENNVLKPPSEEAMLEILGKAELE